MATHDSAERPIDRWFARYAADHRHPANVAIHWLAVPAILWSVVALLWCIPVPGTWFNAGLWAALAMFAAWMFYYRASRSLGFGMLAVLVAMAWLTRWLHDWLGTDGLLWTAVAVFVIAWIAQFIGHKVEGRRPSFLTDLTYLLVGPAWLLSKVYRSLGWRY
ncbi:MAG TPA: Mpo1-like protein [Xanthomonadaceae bacterium]|nr:Mpo1-like protein [Xanthomonadaceae bacterium]